MNNDTKLKKLLGHFVIEEIRDIQYIPIETKAIKSYFEYGDKIGIACQVEGKVVKAEKLPPDYPVFPNMWRFTYNGETWIASDYAFKD